MPKARYAKRVMHAPDDLLAMVADVEKYPEFVDFIAAMRVLSREEKSPSHTHFEAEALIAYKMVNEQFASIVDVYSDQHKIVVEKSDRSGAVKSLQNIWIFHPLADGSSLVELFVDVRLKAFFLDRLLADKFERAATQIMESFEERASRIYETVGEASYDASAEIASLGLHDVVEMA